MGLKSIDKREEKKVGGLKSIDKAAAEKGTGITTLWQFVKFIFVSLLAFIVQFGTLNLLYLLPQIKALFDTPFSWFVFNSPVESNGLGYFIAFNVSNILAQIVAFFVNREKTFNSSANIAVTLPIYIAFTIFLVCFSAWLSPTLQGKLLALGVDGQLSANISAMTCSCVQFFAYFPFNKILFRKPKAEN
jgi:putative flippase GtrA